MVQDVAKVDNNLAVRIGLFAMSTGKAARPVGTDSPDR
jgi:hypothetical protein